MKDINIEKEKFKKLNNITSLELNGIWGAFGKAYMTAYSLADLLKEDEEEENYENNEF